MKKYFLVFLFFLAAANCSPLEKGQANIVPLMGDKNIHGTVKFIETDKGLKVIANLKGLPPGKHGFHIHQYGELGDEGKDAGGHYNPDHVKHGFIITDGYKNAEAGDFGNIIADKSGNAQLELFIPEMRLNGGKYNIAGRSVIIHKNPDDFSQPSGNAGPRIAGGIIYITK